MESLDVVPVLLQERDEEIDRNEHVLPQLMGFHGNVTDGDTETQDLLQLELNVGTDFIGLLLKILRVSSHNRELTQLRHGGPEETRNLRDQRLRPEEGVERLGEPGDYL
jgi:hypothetical protein